MSNRVTFSLSSDSHARRAGRRLFAATTTCVFVTLLLTVPINAVSEYDGILPLWGPYLTAVSETGITVNWRTENATWGSVFYANENYFDTHRIYNEFINDSERELHHVQLTSLTPNTTYHYCVSIEGESTADYTFTTLGNDKFTFIVYGDTQEQLPAFTQLQRHKIVADRIASEDDISFILHCGDLINDVENSEEWKRFFEAARPALAKMPIFPVLGNHETNSTNYYDAFGVSQWYSFNCSNAHFVMLDSNMLASIQAEWLAQDLAVDADWKFVVFHHPPYSSVSGHWGGWLDLRTAWESEFVDNDVNTVFTGHVHAYERSFENSIHYAVLGIGGGACDMLTEEKTEGYRNSFENTLGYARVTVDGNVAFMEIIKVADVSGSEITFTYPPNTVFEKVDLSPEPPFSKTSLKATANIIKPPIGVELKAKARIMLAEDGFAVGPADLNVTLLENGNDTAFVYVTSYRDGELVVGTEDLPFSVKPKTIPITATDRNRQVVLTVYGNASLPAGQYSGKLTFLFYVGSDVAIGVKINTIITQSASGETRGVLDDFLEIVRQNYVVIIAVAGILVALVLGIFIGKKSKKNV